MWSLEDPSSSCGLREGVCFEVLKTWMVLWYQADVCAACGIAENDASRVLKPYQLVGVNFMLLLHRKNVGGGISPVAMTVVEPGTKWSSSYEDFVHGFSGGFWRRRSCVIGVLVV